jgi:hypothetical protein
MTTFFLFEMFNRKSAGISFGVGRGRPLYGSFLNYWGRHDRDFIIKYEIKCLVKSTKSVFIFEFYWIFLASLEDF